MFNHQNARDLDLRSGRRRGWGVKEVGPGEGRGGGLVGGEKEGEGGRG